MSGVEGKIREKIRDGGSIIEYYIGKSDDVSFLEELRTVIDSGASSEEDVVIQLLKVLRSLVKVAMRSVRDANEGDLSFDRSQSIVNSEELAAIWLSVVN